MRKQSFVLAMLLALPAISSGQGGTQGFWTPINPTPSPHRNHTATTLADSKILVAGGLVGDPLLGCNQSPPQPTTAAAVLYRPEFNDWLPVSSMAGDRFFHGAAPLFGATSVLVAGGYNSTSVTLCANLGGELFHPPDFKDLFTVISLAANHLLLGEAPTLDETVFLGRYSNSSVELRASLRGETAFLSGGGSGNCGTSALLPPINTAEIFHENTLGWTAAAPMNVARAEFTLVTLLNGLVLAAGSGSAEIYNPGSDTWTPTSSMQATRFGAAGTILPDGRVFLAGGDSGGGFLGAFCPADAEVYDPSVDTWFNAGGMTLNHSHGTATPYHLPDGSLRVLVAGGQDGNDSNLGVSSVAESWNPGTNTFIPAGNMLVPRVFHTATLRSDGKILVTGGINELGDVETRSEVYDPVTNSWSIAAPMIFQHAGHTASNILDLNGNLTGKVLVAGGQSGGPVTATSEIFQTTPLASSTFIGSQPLPNSSAVSACQPDVIIATVSSSTGLGTPTGSVSFLGFGGLLLGPTSLNSGVYSLDALLPAGNYQIFARYFGDSNFLPSDSQTLAVQSIPPSIVVSGPNTNVALGSPINLVASVPTGAVPPFSFTWMLPNGSSFSGNPLATAPSMLGSNVYTVNGTDSDGCPLNPASFTVNALPAGVNLIIRVASLSRDGAGNIGANFTVTQQNGDALSSVQVTSSTLGVTSSSSTFPFVLGPLAGGATTGFTLAYPGAAAAPGTQVRLAVTLMYMDSVTGISGTAGGSFRVTAP